MKIQLASDLHHELLSPTLANERIIQPAPGADVLVLAGDIHVGLGAVELFKDWPVAVLYLAGNHEFYGHDWARTRDDLRQACLGTQIRFMDNDSIVIDGVRFVGTTLWTDFRMRGFTQSQAMTAVESRLNDYFKIQTPNGSLRAAQTLEDHLTSRNWLAEQLSQPFEGKTVVLSHHAPHALSIHPRFSGDVLNAGFVSDLTELLFRADLWVHGHVHDSFDYQVGRCRVVANPSGYALNRASLLSMDDVVFENKSFDSSLVVEIT